MEMLTIGDLARQARVNRETVRYYERRQLLPRPPRSMAGYRVFPDDAVKRLRFIQHAKALGFSLEKIKELLALRMHSQNRCDSVRERTQAKIADLEDRIAALQRMRRALAELVGACARKHKANPCPILESLEREGDAT